METAAAVEIDQGGLRRYFLEDFHRCLEKPRTTLGFSTVTTGSAAIDQKPKTNKQQNRTDHLLPKPDISTCYRQNFRNHSPLLLL